MQKNRNRSKKELKNGVDVKTLIRRRNFLIFGMALLAMSMVFSSCNEEKSLSPIEESVVINGVNWATCNVDRPGSFAATPESAGMFYQWNRKTAWNAADKRVTGWDNSYQSGTQWASENDPSPAGWRVPTAVEIQSLLDDTKVNCVWIIQNGVNGRKFTDKTTGASIFIPAIGWREGGDGVLCAVGENGSYWSSTRTEKDEVSFGWEPGLRVYNLRFRSSFADCYNELPSYGFPIRSVAKGEDDDENEWLSKEVLERVPDEILTKAKDLGFEINGGKTPPNIEGSYYATPVILVNSASEDDESYIGTRFRDGTFIFSEQDNMELTVVTYIEEMGVGSDTGVGAFVTGNGNKFSVFVIMPNMYSKTTYFFISGKIENGGIRNLHFLLLREDLQRLFKDGDGLAERTTSTKISTQKISKTTSETLLPSVYSKSDVSQIKK